MWGALLFARGDRRNASLDVAVLPDRAVFGEVESYFVPPVEDPVEVVEVETLIYAARSQVVDMDGGLLVQRGGLSGGGENGNLTWEVMDNYTAQTWQD